MKSIVVNILILILITYGLTNCIAKKESVIVGGEYDSAKNRTEYFVLPYGSTLIPGKWNKTGYNSISNQQFFKNKDTIEIAVTFNSIYKYEFNTNRAIKGYNFVSAFYEWDSKYFVDKYGLNRSVVEKDSINNFIISRIYGKLNNKEYDTYFFIGEKNGNCSNFSISYTNKWDEKYKIDFLKSLFFNK